jgi:hypothetical protein
MGMSVPHGRVFRSAGNYVKPSPLSYQPLTEMIIRLYLTNHWIFRIDISYLYRLDNRLSSDINISGEILEINNY